MRRTNISESHPIDPHYIIPINFNDVLELPESHTWCRLSTDHKPLMSPGKIVVPVIDMNDSNVMHLMKKAGEEWGIFQIINHGIEADLFQKLEDQMRKLFSLPSEQKLRALKTTNDATGYGAVKLSPFYTKLMWAEGFTIQGSPLEHAHSLWPQDSTIRTTFCNVIDEYQEALNGLSQKIFTMMLMSLGLSYDDLKWSVPNTGSICTTPALQLNFYPTCPNPSKAMGLAPHTDSSLITLVYQSNHIGLQVFHDKEGWIVIEPIPGALVVNMGDLFHILSNGILKSPLHQAMVNKAQARLSAAFFFGPPKDVEISPAMKLVEPDKLPLYHPVTWQKYLNLKAVYFDALDHIRLDPTKAEI